MSLELLFGLRNVRVRQIDLVDHWNDRQVLLHRQVHVGDCLRLDALGGVDDQEARLRTRSGCGKLRRKNQRAQGIDKIEFICFTVF